MRGRNWNLCRPLGPLTRAGYCSMRADSTIPMTGPRTSSAIKRPSPQRIGSCSRMARAFVARWSGPRGGPRVVQQELASEHSPCDSLT